jgi:polar amino acid transport system ATP-binding protein
MANPTVLEIRNLHKAYHDLDVLSGIDVSVGQGETVAIIGPSGSGKSTFLRCINFVETPTSGEILLSGKRVGAKESERGIRPMSNQELAPQRAEMGMVFQSFNLWPHLTVLDNVALAIREVQRKPSEEARTLAENALEKVHMEHKAEAWPTQLSGGQQQRIGIARALAQQPRLMLFDEPTSALDPELVNEVLRVIHELADEGRTMVLVTHEIRFARDVADRVIFLDHGNIVEEGAADDVLANPQSPRLINFLRQFEQG